MSHASLQIIFTCPISLIFFPPLLNGETEAWDLRKRTHVPVVNRRQSQHCSFLHVRRTSLGQLNVGACIVHSDILISFLGHSGKYQRSSSFPTVFLCVSLDFFFTLNYLYSAFCSPCHSSPPPSPFISPSFLTFSFTHIKVGLSRKGAIAREPEAWNENSLFRSWKQSIFLWIF